jgi:sialidase-1
MNYNLGICSFKSGFYLISTLIFIFTKSYCQEKIVFENGEKGYQCFRIPAIVKAPNGNLIAFAEGRKQNCADFGDVDIVLKISEDNGKNWSELQIVADYGVFQVGNPAPVFDLMDENYPNGRLFLFYNSGVASEQEVREGKAIREIWYKTSTDNGSTWSESVNITEFVSKPNKPEVNTKYKFKEDWRSYANTPGHAIQLKNSKSKGTLFIPANHSSGKPLKDYKDYQAHAFYTTDHAKTWKLMPSLPVLGSNESTAVELVEGQILMNCRNQSGDFKFRIMALSKIGGKKWQKTWVSNDLIDPICQGSMVSTIQHLSRKQIILFSNLDSQSKRENLTIKISEDNGYSWKSIKSICKTSAAYSDLVVLQNQEIGILFEKDNYSKIVFSTFNL